MLCGNVSDIPKLSLKVDFTTSRVVTAIATQGRSAGYTVSDQYVTAYRLLYSDNCVDFTVYNETGGAAKVQFKSMGYIILKAVLCDI